MSREAYRGPKIPRILLDQVQASNGSRPRNQPSRKVRRKDERRQQKKLAARLPRRSSKQSKPAWQRRDHGQHSESQSGSEDDLAAEDSSIPELSIAPQSTYSKPLKSILKKGAEKDEQATCPKSEDTDDGDKSDVSTASDASSFAVSRRAAREGLVEDDAEIAALEKRLGVKGKSKSQEGGDVGLDWLLNGSDGDLSDDEFSRKRKRTEDTRWLRDKRLKATNQDVVLMEDDVSVSASEDIGSEGDESGVMSNEGMDKEDFTDFDSEDDGEDSTKQSLCMTRENPYVAPVSSGVTVNKYIPPSMRKPAASDDETIKQIRRQVQGQLNRLGEANFLSIVQGISELYTKNARQLVTSSLVDLLIGLVANPSSLNDNFLVLHAGFLSALYKSVGTDIGAQFVENLVRCYDKHLAESTNKQCLNLLAFLCALYNFQMVGSTIVFDYIRSLLEELTENNTELLLRIIRTSGQQLRHDDPSALKDIVFLVQRCVTKLGEANLSVRTKFMIETINNLKNNRVKTDNAPSVAALEQTTRMKKQMSALTARAKTTEPLRMSLADIRDSEKKGKWWLVGASYQDPAKMGQDAALQPMKTQRDEDDGYESETPGHVNLRKLARQQGMNTVVRRAIFVSLLSAADYIDAYMRLLKLHLKAKQQLEIPRVLVHCVGSEQVYNPYYGLIARKFCNEHRIRKAFAFVFWDFCTDVDTDEDDDDDVIENGDAKTTVRMRKIVNLAKFYGSLVAQGALDVTVLKKLEFSYLSANTSMLVEVMLTTIFTQARAMPDGLEQVVKDVFGLARRAATIAPGLRFFIETVVSKAELAKKKKDVRAVKEGCSTAVDVLAKVVKRAPSETMSDDDDNESTDDSDEE